MRRAQVGGPSCVGTGCVGTCGVFSRGQRWGLKGGVQVIEVARPEACDCDAEKSELRVVDQRASDTQSTLRVRPDLRSVSLLAVGLQARPANRRGTR